MTQHGDAEFVARLCNGWPLMHASYASAASVEVAQ